VVVVVMWMKVRRLLVQTIKLGVKRWPLTLVLLLFIAVTLSSRLRNSRRTRTIISNDVTKFRIFKWADTDWDDDDIISNNKRIFFHETSGRNDLDVRQTCAVESAALHNPQRPIQLFVLSTADVNETDPWLQVLSQYSNVDVIVVDDEEAYYRDTPLENWFLQGEWRESYYQIVHKSDYMRMLTLSRGGGMYMDLDYITLRPLEPYELLSNFFLIESADMKLLSNSVVHLERGHRLIDAIIERLVKYYRPDDYIWHGPSLVSNVMSKKCNVKRGQPNSNDCTDVRLLPHHFFHPVPTTHWQKTFRDADDAYIDQLMASPVGDKRNGSYGVHFWSGKSKNEPLIFNSMQLYARLFAIHCPRTNAIAHHFVSNESSSAAQ